MSPRASSPCAGIDRASQESDHSHAPASVGRAVAKVLALAGAAAVLPSVSSGSPTGSSFAIKFAALETNGMGGDSTVTGPAGVLNTVNWNNTSGQSGGPQLLTFDRNGALVNSTASVTWSSSVGTWSSTGRGEENNSATGENRDLMAGYLDTSNTSQISLTVDGLNFANSPFTLGYDVYVYIHGGVNGRGGTYTLGNTTFYHEVTSGFNGTFVRDTTPDTPQGPEGSFGSNYIQFTNVTGSSFTITTTPTVPIGGTLRAPINAIEVVAIIPEPASLAAVAVGAATLLGLRRRRPS